MRLKLNSCPEGYQLFKSMKKNSNTLSNQLLAQFYYCLVVSFVFFFDKNIIYFYFFFNASAYCLFV
ncbi:hypothetical protein C2G38_2059148, partial [Gigaspora rosea]